MTIISLVYILARQPKFHSSGVQRNCSWLGLAGALLLACCFALFLPASATAAPPAPTPEPTVQTGAEVLPQQEVQPEPEVQAAANLQNIVGVATGLSHTCAVNSIGGVLCWGDNAYGQLGNDARTFGSTNPYPRSVTGLSSDVKAIAAGDEHSCALTTVGVVKCWGSNAYGQLGDGTTTTQLTPITVTNLISGVQAIAAGGSQTCALTAVGGVKCWGNLVTTPADVQGLTSGVIAIAVGYMHACAVVGDPTSGGGVRCWGANDTGQLGDGTTTFSSTPVDVVGLGSGVKAIAAGGAPVDRFTQGGHTCALTTDGAVKCWGWNDEGQLGDDSTANRLTPVNVAGLSSGVQDITAGDKHTCALTGDLAGNTAGVKCWGENRYGQLGVGSTESYPTPVQVGGFTSGVQDIAAGGAHTCAVTAVGGLKCWGRNASGQLGNFTLGSQSLLPVTVIVPDGITFMPQVWRQAAPVTTAQ